MKRLAHDSRPGDDAAMFTTLTDPGVMALKQAVQGWGWVKTVKTMLGTMFGTMFGRTNSDSATNWDPATNDSTTYLVGFRN